MTFDTILRKAAVAVQLDDNYIVTNGDAVRIRIAAANYAGLITS